MIRFGIGAGILAAALATAWFVREAAMAEPARPAADGGVAVVELFTSEGCSSCPPADARLGELIAEAKDKKWPVYALAFHVDYWDRLGWKDPFGSKMASDRQRAYAEALGSSVYTPQAVVNGGEEFVGSENDRLHKSVAAALARPAAAKVSLTAGPGDGAGKVVVRYAVAGAPAGSVLQVAYAEARASTDVKRGENGGRNLAHFNVVLALRTVELDSEAKGEATLDVPGRKSGTVVAFVQDPKKWKVLGAASADIGKE